MACDLCNYMKWILCYESGNVIYEFVQVHEVHTGAMKVEMLYMLYMNQLL